MAVVVRTRMHLLEDGHGHGTHVGGTVGAKGQLAIGVVGVAAGDYVGTAEASLMPIRKLWFSSLGRSMLLTPLPHYKSQQHVGSSGDVANYSVGPNNSLHKSRHLMMLLRIMAADAGIKICLGCRQFE